MKNPSPIYCASHSSVQMMTMFATNIEKLESVLRQDRDLRNNNLSDWLKGFLIRLFVDKRGKNWRDKLHIFR